MWLSKDAIGRIRELEALLRDSVPRAVYDAALKRIAEQERRIDWQCDMLLRRGQSIPLPPLPDEKPQSDEKPALSEADRVRAQAVIDHGLSIGKQQTEITEAVQSLHLGLDEAAIAAAINASRNGQPIST